jgi:hypothetical protein
MRRPWWLLLVLAGLIAAAPGPAGPEADELARNRRLLDKWRADPEHYARLQRDLHDFYALPTAQQERLRQLDRQLHELDPATQQRLWAVLERYSVWLERLPPADRRRVLAAADPAERLRIIRALRERQWLDRLPRRQREQLLLLPAEKRAERIAELRRKERDERRRWAQPQPKAPQQRPRRVGELPADVQRFLHEQLWPRLSATERTQLRKAEGRWPDLPRTVLQLAERYPVLPALPPPYVLVTRYENLPLRVRLALPRTALRSRGIWEELKAHQGPWPDFALALSRTPYARRKGKLPALGASRPEEFPPAVRDFLANTLPLHLGRGEADALRKLEGRWPEYPLRLHELARRHRLVIPGMSLPGPRQLWEAARS